ncbi:hypothetical protein [Acinetobacter baylyi]|uniref:hypothetical protein n=1 Tax=Acinetobacter baylyi TaxID=202950 RepID=UPI000EA02C51|nr:hypothetical protein [Acinetobacter baylyi]
MKKYFNIEESLLYLNKNIDKHEQLSIRDLFVFAAKKVIQPCFFYRGVILWQELEDEDGEVYRNPSFSGYLTANDLGETLLEFYDDDLDFFKIKWVTIVDPIYSELPDDIKKIGLYDERNEVHNLIDIFYRDSDKYENSFTKIIDQMIDKEFLSFVHTVSGWVNIKFSSAYFSRSELENLKSTSVMPENIIDVKKEITTREKNNASLIIGAMSELLKIDLTQPYGEANKQIRETIEKMGGKLSKDTIGRWLNLARENIK